MEGSTLSEAEDTDAPLAVKTRLRFERLMRTVFHQDPLWLTFRDPHVERAYVLHAAKRACMVQSPHVPLAISWCLFFVTFVKQ